MIRVVLGNSTTSIDEAITIRNQIHTWCFIHLGKNTLRSVKWRTKIRERIVDDHDTEWHWNSVYDIYIYFKSDEHATFFRLQWL